MNAKLFRHKNRRKILAKLLFLAVMGIIVLLIFVLVIIGYSLYLGMTLDSTKALNQAEDFQDDLDT